MNWKDRQWKKVKEEGYPRIVEVRDDGTATLWSPGLWGAVGHCGELKPEVVLEPIKTKKDREALRCLIAGLEKSDRTQEALFMTLKAKRDLLGDPGATGGHQGAS